MPEEQKTQRARGLLPMQKEKIMNVHELMSIWTTQIAFTQSFTLLLRCFLPQNLLNILKKCPGFMSVFTFYYHKNGATSLQWSK